jgi:hypothetical protein
MKNKRRKVGIEFFWIMKKFHGNISLDWKSTVCNEAENIKRNCPSVKKILERNTARCDGGKLWYRSG